MYIMILSFIVNVTELGPKAMPYFPAKCLPDYEVIGSAIEDPLLGGFALI